MLIVSLTKWKGSIRLLSVVERILMACQHNNQLINEWVNIIVGSSVSICLSMLLNAMANNRFIILHFPSAVTMKWVIEEHS